MRGQLTLRVCRRRHLVYSICHRHVSGLQDSLVQLLLLHLLQLLLEFRVVHRLSHCRARDGIHDFLAERVLVPQFLPIASRVSRLICSHVARR